MFQHYFLSSKSIALAHYVDANANSRREAYLACDRALCKTGLIHTNLHPNLLLVFYTAFLLLLLLLLYSYILSIQHDRIYGLVREQRLHTSFHNVLWDISFIVYIFIIYEQGMFGHRHSQFSIRNTMC